MSIDDGDQERWDELPGDFEVILPKQTGTQENEDFIECIKVKGPTYSYASCVGPIMVQHESEKVSLEQLPIQKL